MRSYYDNSVKEFLNDDEYRIVHKLVTNNEFDSTDKQLNAWREQISILKKQLNNSEYYQYHIFFEFVIPRMGSRIDVVIFIPTKNPHLVLLEFKVGSKDFESTSKDQIINYSIELRNFHKGSHGAKIFPAVVATKANFNEFNVSLNMEENGISDVSLLNRNDISAFINNIEKIYEKKNAIEWEKSPYNPTPTIIEAARHLFRKQDVKDITRSEGGENITITTAYIEELIKEAKENNQKKIIFVTGVPGSGKTLVGLKIAADRRIETESIINTDNIKNENNTNDYD